MLPSLPRLRFRWRFANTTLLALSLILMLILLQINGIDALMAHVGTWGYVGVFFTGLFFVSTFTAAPAAVILFSFPSSLPLLPVVVVAGFGAMMGDYVLFRFVRDHLAEEWTPLFARLSHTALGRLFSSPFFVWLSPVVGALLIASPLPDEFGVGLLGMARMQSAKVLALTFVLNTAGILLILLVARAVH